MPENKTAVDLTPLTSLPLEERKQLFLGKDIVKEVLIDGKKEPVQVSTTGDSITEYSIVVKRKNDNGEFREQISDLTWNNEDNEIGRETAPKFQRKGLSRFLMETFIFKLKMEGKNSIKGTIRLNNRPSLLSRLQLQDPESGKYYLATVSDKDAEIIDKAISEPDIFSAKYITITTHLNILVTEQPLIKKILQIPEKTLKKIGDLA